MNKKKWVVLFSRTGSELSIISEQIDREPDAIITNKDISDILGAVDINNSSGLIKLLKKGVPLYTLPNKPDVETYKRVFNDANITKDTLITLHGFLRILPREICEEYTIYNGHPGDIVKYPELKGFNPQEKAFYAKHPTAGSVIHKVTEEVDEGDIVARKVCDFNINSLDEAYKILHNNSVQLWVEFLTNIL